MKRIISLLCVLTVLMALPICASAESTSPVVARLTAMRTALIIMLVILAVMVVASMVFVYTDLKKCSMRRRKPRLSPLSILCLIVAALVLICSIYCFATFRGAVKANTVPAPTTEPTTVPTEPTTEATEPPTEPPTPVPEPTPELSPVRTESSDPANWDVKWELLVGSEVVDSFQREETIDFGDGEDYYPLPGVPTFRGNNYRNGGTYGITNITEETLDAIWSTSVGSLDGWPGVGWTGQPLVVKWDEETKAIMNLYESKKAKADLVEVICTTLDGYIYFLDLEDGTYTRDPMYLGMSVKGTGALDPRGYPLMFCGSGLNQGQSPRMYAISLIDTTILWEQSGSDGMNYRAWCGFDGSPIISGEADTLLWGGENGLLYTIKLNTKYDKAAGTISVDPQNVIRTRYSSKYSYERYVGYESSILTVGKYAFIGDNGGFMFCVDLQTMELIWAQFTGDDINATPVFQWEEDGAYLYTATSADYAGGTCRMHKINANTGEIVWEQVYDDVVINKDASRGVLSSPVLGKPGSDLEGMIIHAIGGTPYGHTGILFALDTATGEIIWEHDMDYYAWSSIAGLYTPENKGYLALGDAAGNLFLIEGKTGKILYTEDLGSNMEASPVVYENTLVIGTRGQQIFGVKIQ